MIKRKRIQVRFLTDIITYIIVKHPQAMLLLQYLQGLRTDPLAVCNELKAMKELEAYQHVNVDDVRVSDAYIAGLTDADGSICLKSSGDLIVTIAQKSCPELLEVIKVKLNSNGRVSKRKEEVTYGATNAVVVIRRLLRFLIAKKEQAEWAIEYQEAKLDLTPQQRAVYIQKLQALKRE